MQYPLKINSSGKAINDQLTIKSVKVIKEIFKQAMLDSDFKITIHHEKPKA